jgi:alkylation response protein AidB-like acyl-CoA dehydrogenase
VISVEQPEHRELRSSIRKLVSRDLRPGDDPAAAATAGVDLWRRLALEIGVAGLTIPERFGGAGATVAELAVVAEEMGRALVSVPYLSTVGLAVPLLLESGDVETQGTWLPRIASGEATAAVAYRAVDGSILPQSLPVSAQQDGSQWLLHGRASFVVEGATADLLLVMARTSGDEPALFALEVDGSGVTRRSLEVLDETRGQAEIIFAATPARCLGTGSDSWSWLVRALEIAAVLLSAEQLGAADRALEMAVDYSKQRSQFGRLIASFQAIKHRCADLAVENDRARSALVHAIWAASETAGAAWLTSASAAAALVCGRAFDNAAQDNIQIHGGIGFTWEHPAHRYFRRAKADAVLLADERHYVDRLLTGAGVLSGNDVISTGAVHGA